MEGRKQEEHPEGYLVVNPFCIAKDIIPKICMQSEHGKANIIFAEPMAESVITARAKEHYPLIIETELLDMASPFAPCKLRSILIDFKYNVTLNVLYVRPEISYLSLLKQYKQHESQESTSCKVSIEQHYADIKEILYTLGILSVTSFFTRIRFYAPNGECVFDTPGETARAVVLAEREFARELAPEEKAVIKEEYEPYVESQDEMDHILSWFAESFRRKAEKEAIEYFSKHKDDPVHREVTIPYWQDRIVQAKNLDLSDVLREALDRRFDEIDSNDN